MPRRGSGIVKHHETRRGSLGVNRGPVWIAVLQRDTNGRDKVLFAVTDRLGVASVVGAMVEHKATESAAFQYIDRVTSEAAAADAVRLARIARAAMATK